MLNIQRLRNLNEHCAQYTRILVDPDFNLRGKDEAIQAVTVECQMSHTADMPVIKDVPHEYEDEDEVCSTVIKLMASAIASAVLKRQEHLTAVFRIANRSFQKELRLEKSCRSVTDCNSRPFRLSLKSYLDCCIPP